ncbi:glycoside hydrolase superfamily [Halenospora varia]|nr:glycoside hydrolase superfamily [Halenospora varia]
MASRALLLLGVLSQALLATAAFPYALPFHTNGDQFIYSNTSQKVQYVGTNWPGHQEAMVPEGLQYASIASIVAKVKSMGLNSVRLTFAIEMIDQILDNGGDVSISDSFRKALGNDKGDAVVAKILKNNPNLKSTTKRLEVFDAVAKEFEAQGVLLHLDNHMSKATWCCGTGDGNGWFGDTYFDVKKWERGWGYMAAHAANWPALSSIGIRNELRKPDGGRGEAYDWYTWYTHMTSAATIINKAAPEALIFFSGLDYDTKISPIPLGSALTSGSKTATFNPSSFPFKNKIVLELHRYDNDAKDESCAQLESNLMSAGYISIDPSNSKTKYKFPMVLTEWGQAQDGKAFSATTYSKCLVEFMQKWKPSGWIQWDLAGSYYLREGTQDRDESWGLLNHEWSAVRSSASMDGSIGKMVKATLL